MFKLVKDLLQPGAVGRMDKNTTGLCYLLMIDMIRKFTS
jgi:hypothetical protein